MNSNITVRRALRADLPDILRVQYEAFGRVAAASGIDPQHLEPLREALDDLYQLFDDGVAFMVASAVGAGEAAVVGSVRGSVAEGVVMVNRLVIGNGWERRGLGNALMDALELEFPDARLFRLYTGADAVGPLALYHGRGYRTVGEEDMGHFRLAWLEKRGSEAVS